MSDDINNASGSQGASVASPIDALMNEAKQKFGIFANSIDELQKKVKDKKSQALAMSGDRGLDDIVDLSRFGRKIDEALVDSLDLGKETAAGEDKSDLSGLAGLAKEAEAENDEAAGEDEPSAEDYDKPSETVSAAIEETKPSNGIADESVLDDIQKITGELRDGRKNQTELREAVEKMKADLAAKEEELRSVASRCDDMATKIRDLSVKL